MNRELSDWAAIAEIVAAFGVILSLMFVGFQIRDGNRETVAATMQAALDSEIHFQSTIALHAETWSKVGNGEELAPGEELAQGFALYTMLMTVYENRFHQYQSGYLDRAPEEVLKTAVHFPIYDAWRQRGGAKTRSPEFLELLDELRAAGTD